SQAQQTIDEIIAIRYGSEHRSHMGSFVFLEITKHC
ncbi:unnamed protein product, partial [marine sediment metagenome]